MPLITLAWLAAAAGLLLGGTGGAAFPAVGGVVLAVAAAAVRKSTTGIALAVLAGCGLVLGHAQRAADARCTRELVATGGATIHLSEPTGPRRSARGFAQAPGCEVRVRVRTGTVVPAGATIRATGQATPQGAGASLVAQRVRVLEPPGVLARWRARAGHTIDRLYGEQAPLARALLIADERDIAPEVRERMADAGIIHMISVSGLHVAVLAESVVLLMLVLRVPIRRAEGIALAVVAGFVLFVGAPAPAVRSGAMFGALVVTRWLQRPTSPWALLALGGLLPLAEPRVVASIGYQLSVVGMAGLLASGMLVRRLPSVPAPPWAGRMGREVLATVIASAVTAPIIAWHFGRVSLAAPLTNLAAAPLFALAQPALFLSLVVAPVEPVARFLADGTGVLLAAIGWVGDTGAGIPGAAVDVMPSTATALLSGCMAAALLATCASRAWIRPALVGSGALVAAIWWPLIRPAPDRLEVHMLDVGQGDAIALRTPRARWIVMDAGNAWRTGDAGERVVLPYLTRRGGPIAALILSHPHTDHVGGAATLLRRMRVGTVLDGGFVHTSEAYAATIASARARGVPWRVVRAGDSLEIDGVRLAILAPDSARAASATDANEASVILSAEYRGVRVLLTGDAEREEEERVRRQYPGQLRADILKVGHHGSATSSSPGFLDAVRPRVALVSVGAGNTYGHPSDAVLDALARRGAHVMRTDDDGTIVVSTDGTSLRVSTGEGQWALRTGSFPR